VITTAAAILSYRLGAGILLAAGLLLWTERAPRAWLRFLLLTAAIAFAASLLGGFPPRETAAAIGALAAAVGIRWGIRNRLGRHRLLAAPLALLGALAAVAGPLPGDAPALVPAAAAFAGAFLLGAAVVTMVLGHWYLVDTSLSIRPLAAGARLFVLGALLRSVVVVAPLCSASRTWPWPTLP